MRAGRQGGEAHRVRGTSRDRRSPIRNRLRAPRGRHPDRGHGSSPSSTGTAGLPTSRQRLLQAVSRSASCSRPRRSRPYRRRRRRADAGNRLASALHASAGRNGRRCDRRGSRSRSRSSVNAIGPGSTPTGTTKVGLPLRGSSRTRLFATTCGDPPAEVETIEAATGDRGSEDDDDNERELPAPPRESP